MVKFTQPVIGPIDTSSLLVAFILSTLKFPLLLLIQSGALSLDPFNLVVGLLSLLKSAGQLVFWVIIIRSLMSWVSQGRSPIEFVLIQLTEPLMAPIRRILPAMGGIDFSAMGVIIVLYLLNYLAMDLFPGLWYLL
ncbi:Integral membrane protein YggT, involved in response to extracytoplasmic stress (osmotic shock) [Cronobacter universalis NCTC 9529]|nr:Integral membrane protein YggT, involved in response to extracytoplasmic stress (osmotic shock) [Cronobacter universalis NCTC 9529]